MDRYVQKLDKEFVGSIVGDFLVKEWYAKNFFVNQENISQVIYQTNDNYYIIKVHDFYIDFGMKSFFSAALERKWRAAMYTKFGDEYLKNLSEHITLSEVDIIKQIAQNISVKKQEDKEIQK